MLHQIYDIIIMYLYLEQKFKEFIVKAGQKFSQLIEKHKKSKMKHVIPKPPQCKWKRRYEQRIKNQMQENNKNLSNHLMPIQQAQNIQIQIKINGSLEKDKNQFDDQQLEAVQQFRQSMINAIKDFCANFQYCSFLFSNVVTIKRPKYLKSKIFITIHNIISKYKIRPVKQNNFYQSISLLNDSIELTINQYWNLSSLSQSERQICIKDIEAAVIQTQIQIQQNQTAYKMMLSTTNKITRFKVEFLQQILHELQIAKIYRYKYSSTIEQLLRKYVINKTFDQRSFVMEPVSDCSYLIARGLQLSDMGLLNRLENIDLQQQKQIYQYWNQKRKSLMLQNSLHQISYYSDNGLRLDGIFSKDIINEIIADESNNKMVVRSYMLFLHKLQQRLLQEDLQFQEYYRNISEDNEKIQKQRQSKFCMCSTLIQQMLSIKMPAKISKYYYNNNLLRICCKWRKLQTCDGLSAAQMIAKLELKQITYSQILSILKHDYIEGVIIPNILLIKQFIKLKKQNLEFIVMIQQMKKQEEQKKKQNDKIHQSISAFKKKPMAINTFTTKDNNLNEPQTNFESISISSSQTDSYKERQEIYPNIKMKYLQINQRSIGEINDEKDENLSELLDSSYSLEQSIESSNQIYSSSRSPEQIPRKLGKKGKNKKQTIDFD